MVFVVKGLIDSIWFVQSFMFLIEFLVLSLAFSDICLFYHTFWVHLRNLGKLLEPSKDEDLL